LISLFLFHEKAQAINAAADIVSGMVSLMGHFLHRWPTGGAVLANQFHNVVRDLHIYGPSI
jgi:hypothetical protein